MFFLFLVSLEYFFFLAFLLLMLFSRAIWIFSHSFYLTLGIRMTFFCLCQRTLYKLFSRRRYFKFILGGPILFRRFIYVPFWVNDRIQHRLSLLDAIKLIIKQINFLQFFLIRDSETISMSHPTHGTQITYSPNPTNTPNITYHPKIANQSHI